MICFFYKKYLTDKYEKCTQKIKNYQYIYNLNFEDIIIYKRILILKSMKN